ncbi:hypothetical protein Lalb_Chr16g0388701 [Lupinus albus]|uniref:Uncharacterized protein n=1 Tax=Lupinus albus TaxID=3870 RepID=A0A6A4PBX6_LUPAL|nr:hypothetical protein Lalb_Chr16g0388701 [Lupinus albus]
MFFARVSFMFGRNSSRKVMQFKNLTPLILFCVGKNSLELQDLQLKVSEL